MFIEIIFIGIMIGLASGGSVYGLGRLELKFIYVIFTAYLIKAGIDFFAPGYHWGGYPYLHLFSYLLLFFALWKNKQIPGIYSISAGTALNFIVIVFNGGQMPVRADVIPNEMARVLAAGFGGTHGLLVEGTKFKFLADIFYLALPYQHQLLSAGDFLIDVGILILLVKATRSSKTL